MTDQIVPVQHPLRAAEVIERSGMTSPPSESDMWVDCPACEQHMSLAEARIEPAEDPQNITAYRCINGCMPLLATGHPNPVAIPGSGRYRLGDFALAPLAPSGLLIALPTGRQIRLTPRVYLSGGDRGEPAMPSEPDW